MEAEVIGFHRPSSEGRTLYVTGIPRYLHRDEKWGALHSIFSKYGPIFDISLPQSPYNQEPINDVAMTTDESVSTETEYGFIKFYSSLAARAAVTNSSQEVFMRHTLKVDMARPRSKPLTLSSSGNNLYIDKCRELCNYYLGFNGWSVRIVAMETIEENKEGCGSVWMGAWCRVEVTVRGNEGGSYGVGEWKREEGEGESDASIEGKIRMRGRAKKTAFNRACVDAFSHILLILLPERPAVAMIVHKPEDQARKLVGELVSTCPPVTVLPWQQPDDNTDREDIKTSLR